MPIAPKGFRVTKFADGFNNPRRLYQTPNGDILVAEANSNHSTMEKILGTLAGASKSNNLNKSADRISLLRYYNGLDKPTLRSYFLESGLNQPFGMLVIGKFLYVANTDSLVRFPYEEGDTKARTVGTKILDLPAGKPNRHWVRNIIGNADGSKIYISVGSGSNAAENGIENELLRATILEINPDGSNLRVFASGLRNTNGMDWAPGSRNLYAVVNERDELGDELVPDYFTRVVENGFYGWPYMYWGQNANVRVKGPVLLIAARTIVPDVNLGSHHAPLGFAFYTSNKFPKKYHGGAFIAEHGSWNRKDLAGYRVSFVAFSEGKPSGPVEDFLVGFHAKIDQKKVYGRPVDVLQTRDGALLVSDDVTNTIWRISHSEKTD